MNVWDFDNTIYDGESTVDFFLFCLKKKKTLIKYLPLVLYTAFLYKIRLLSIDKLLKITEKMTSEFINSNENFDSLAKEFWKLNRGKLKESYLHKLNSTDVIITASPRFLIENILPTLGITSAICSEFNTSTGQFEFVNYKENKVILFKRKYPNQKIVNFYTDSLNDLPLINMAENAFLVRANKEPILIKSKTK